MNNRKLVDLGNRVALIIYYRSAKNVDNAIVNECRQLKGKREKSEEEDKRLYSLITHNVDSIVNISDVCILNNGYYYDPNYPIPVSLNITGEEYKKIEQAIAEIRNHAAENPMTLGEYLNIDELPF